MRLRELESGEEARLLDLLDGWPFSDGRRGRDFFRRYLEDDPAYRARNVWVAASDAQLVACVQVFPRFVRTTVGNVECGGIGSVFTRPAYRRSGLASDLLGRAVESIEARGMALSLLVASRVDWYSSLGWRELSSEEVLLEPGAGDRRQRGMGRPLEPTDLERVVEIAAVYGEERPGTVVRDAAAWTASLRLAGDPHEDFVVVGDGRDLVAYLRLARLDGAWRALEWGCRDGGHEALADLLLSRAGGGVVLPPIRDERLELELGARGAALRPRRAQASWMGRTVARTEPEVRRLLPPDRFAFWPADRF